jgi:hypothetical protein
MTTMKSAKKVTKRGWSYDKFQASVTAAAKRQDVSLKGKSSRVQACYEEGVTVRGTIDVLRDAKPAKAKSKKSTNSARVPLDKNAEPARQDA